MPFNLQSVLLCLLAFPVVASAQNTSDVSSTPESLVHAYFSAMSDDRIDDLVALMHPEALAQYRTAMIGLFDSAAKYGEEKMMLALFPGITTPDSIRALDARGVYVGFMKGVMSRDGTLGFGDTRPQLQVMGHVMEGNDSAHVVYRLRIEYEGRSNSDLNTLMVRRHGSGWGLMLTDEISGLATIWEMSRGMMEEPILNDE